GCIEDSLAGDEQARERVAVPMFIGDFTGAARQETLTGEREIRTHEGYRLFYSISAVVILLHHAVRRFHRSIPAMLDTHQTQLAGRAFDDECLLDVIEQANTFRVERMRAHEVLSGQQGQPREAQRKCEATRIDSHRD